MEITHLGQSCFKLRGKHATLVIDPKESVKSADVLVFTGDVPKLDFVKGSENGLVMISGPGEYEIKGLSVVGIQTFREKRNIVYRIGIDGINIVYIGDSSHKFTDSEKELLSGCDILLISALVSSDTVSQLEPGIVIPVGQNSDEISRFLKEMGKEGITPVSKINITRDKLPAETTVIVLE